MGGRYRGNRQKWFAMRFTGSDADINLAAERSICANRTIAPMSSPPSGVAAIMVSARPSAQADQTPRPVKPGLHHQHQCGAAGDRPHRRIVGVEQPQCLAERRWLDQFERGHYRVPLTRDSWLRELWGSFSLNDARHNKIRPEFDRSRAAPKTLSPE